MQAGERSAILRRDACAVERAADLSRNALDRASADTTILGNHQGISSGTSVRFLVSEGYLQFND